MYPNGETLSINDNGGLPTNQKKYAFKDMDVYIGKTSQILKRINFKFLMRLNLKILQTIIYLE